MMVSLIIQVTKTKKHGQSNMSIEVELKVKISGKEEIIDKLENINFTKSSLVVETDTYFTSSHHDFISLDEALRIRNVLNKSTNETKSVITYKGAKLDNISMSRKELETEIKDSKIVKEILENIGFKSVPPLVKERQYLKNNNITACVDTVKGLGDYLELEIIVGNNSEKEKSLEVLENLLLKLGYSMKDTINTSYLSMLMNISE